MKEKLVEVKRLLDEIINESSVTLERLAEIREDLNTNTNILSTKIAQLLGEK
jgi:hypothetical protein